MPASRHQDHTTSPSAMVSFAFRHNRVHRILRPTSVTMAKRPSCGHRMWTILPVIWGNDQSRDMRHIGTTGKSPPPSHACHAPAVKRAQRDGSGSFEYGRANLWGVGQIKCILQSWGEKPKGAVWSMANAPKPPNPNQLAGAIVDIATGHTQPQIDSEPSAASQLGGLGGLKGGRARADRLSRQQRKEIACRAAAVRWRKDDGGSSGSEQNRRGDCRR
jgi:hypothetical protein